MTNWGHLNTFNNASLLRLDKRNLQRFFNSVPNNNRWNGLHERLRKTLNMKRKSDRTLRLNKVSHRNNVRRHEHGIGALVTPREAAWSRAQVGLINLELALRQKQLKRAAEKALSYGVLNRIKRKRRTRNFLREELSLYGPGLHPSQVKSRKMNI